MGVISGDHSKCECAPLNLRPADPIKGQAVTPDAKGWTGHSDAFKARHPDDARSDVLTRGCAAAGTPDARKFDSPVQYLGAQSGESTFSAALAAVARLCAAPKRTHYA
jgi:hypothetical protein